MPTDQEKLMFDRRRSGPSPLVRIKKVPQLPPDVVKRFPSLVKWQRDMEQWRIEANNALGGGPG